MNFASPTLERESDGESDGLECVVLDFAMTRERQFCFHEAGHAVAAFVFGLRPSVIVDDEWGLTLLPGSAGVDVDPHTFELVDFAPAPFGDSRTELELEQSMTFYQAGPLAQSIASNLALSNVWKNDCDGDRRNWDEAFAALSRKRTADRATEWKRSEASARALVLAEWRRVERLTGALLVRKRLSAVEVALVLR